MQTGDNEVNGGYPFFTRAPKGINDFRILPRRCTKCRRWTRDSDRFCFGCRHDSIVAMGRKLGDNEVQAELRFWDAMNRVRR